MDPRALTVVCLLFLGPTVVAAGTTSSSVNKPNLLLLFPDQWRYDWDGHHSDPTYRKCTHASSLQSASPQTCCCCATVYHRGPIPLHVPVLDKLAQEGTRFTQAIVAAPVCAPSRACLASGREYDEAGVACNFCNDYPINRACHTPALLSFFFILRTHVH